MSPLSDTDGDGLVTLLGLRAEAPPVQASLMQLARGMQPELDPEDDEALVDWVTVNEIGLEYGFEDEAYVLALDPDLRRKAPLILSQLYFYGNSRTTQPFPFALPFGLTLGDDRDSVRQKLAAYEKTRRSYVRDAWRLAKFNVTIAYRSERGSLESILCHIPYASWPPLPGEVELLAPFTPTAFTKLFGLRWSSADLRAHLAPLGYEQSLAEVRTERVADLRLSHGLELLFGPSDAIEAADQRYPRSLAFAGVTYYANRELDAREWSGALPNGLAFADTQTELRNKVGGDPAEQSDDSLSGQAVWYCPGFTLHVLYSNLENRLLRVTMMAPGFWEASKLGE